MTSGGLEPVQDGGFDGHSVFTSFLLKALRDPGAPFVVPSDLFSRIRGGVAANAAQQPRLGTLFGTGGDEGGEFVLLRQGSGGLEAALSAKQEALSELQQLEAASRAAAERERAEAAAKEKELAALDAKIAALQSKLGTAGAGTGTLDEIVALARQKEAEAERLAALRRQAEAEKQRREAEIERLRRAEQERKHLMVRLAAANRALAALSQHDRGVAHLDDIAGADEGLGDASVVEPGAVGAAEVE